MNFLKVCVLSAGMTACSGVNAVLTSPGAVVSRGALQCAVVKEWNVSSVRKDGKSNGCWCMLPPMEGATPDQVIISFSLTEDLVCDEKVSMDEITKHFNGK